MVPAQLEKGAGGVSAVYSEALSKQVVNLYVERGYSTRRVAEIVGIDRLRVSQILRDRGIVLAPRGAGRHRPLKVEGAITEGALRYLYINCQMSSVDIGRGLGISDRLVRSRLKLWGIETRTRGQFNRFDRGDVDPEDLRPLYVDKEWAASSVGLELGVSGTIVLRSAHTSGLPVRAGGSHRPSESFDIILIDALYEDTDVSRVLTTHGVPVVRDVGPLWQRFPSPVELTRGLLSDLYNTCGLSTFHIELVTGAPAPTILRRLEDFGIERRGRGGRSPFMRRWHAKRRRATTSARLAS
jgi:transposase